MSSFSDGILYSFSHTLGSSLAYIYRYPRFLGNDHLATVPTVSLLLCNHPRVIDGFGVVTIQRRFRSVLEDAKGDCVALDSHDPNEVEGQ